MISVEREQRFARHGHSQEEQRQPDLQSEARHYRAERKGAAVLRQNPRRQQNHHDTEQGLKMWKQAGPVA
jgi:hypothetical protein